MTTPYRPFNFTSPDWSPLERAVVLAGLPLRRCVDYMWMHEDPPGVHHYKNRATRRYLQLTKDTPEDRACRLLREVSEVNTLSRALVIPG